MCAWCPEGFHTLALDNDGGQMPLTTLDSAGAHQHGFEVLIRAEAGTNKIRGRSGDYFVYASTGALPVGGLPGYGGEVYLGDGEATREMT